MYRTIVVGHDGSRRSDDALAMALQLREPEEGRVVLAAVNPLLSELDSPASRPTRRAQGDAAHAAVRRAATCVPASVPLEFEVVDGATPAAGLAAIAAARQADLICLGWSDPARAGHAARLSTA